MYSAKKITKIFLDLQHGSGLGCCLVVGFRSLYSDYVFLFPGFSTTDNWCIHKNTICI